MFSQQEYCRTKHSGSKDIPVRKYSVSNGISVRKYSGSRNIAVQTIQAVGILQYKLFRQWEYFGTKYSVGKDIPVYHI